MKTVVCDQYDQAYWAARRGVPTASEFGCILTPKDLAYSKQAISYIYRLIGDRHDPNYGLVEDYVSAAMKNGARLEPEARRFYEFERDIDVQVVGFCLTDDGRFGCSPDALVGDDGGLELKSPSHATHVKYLLDGELPPEYKAQVHGCLIVTGRQWWDFVSYAPGLPPLLVRVEPDNYTEALRRSLDQFWSEYQSALERLNAKAA